MKNLRVQSFEDRLVVSWDEPPGSFSGYKLYFESDSPVSIDAATSEYEISGLSPATAYSIRVTTIDPVGTESEGRNITGVTWLDNPDGLAAEGLNNRVQLSWDAVTPANLLKTYRLYAETVPFASVEGLSPRLTVPAGQTTASVVGLSNGVTYYLAVTAVNLSDGERPDVSTVSNAPAADAEGPILTGAILGGAPLIDGMQVAGTVELMVTATDQSGVSRVEFLVDDQLLAVDVGGPTQFHASWDPTSVEDGNHTVTMRAFDTLNNQSSVSANVTVALAPPAAPVITEPVSGLRTRDGQTTVSGTAERESLVHVYLDGVEAEQPVSAGNLGQFSVSVSLAEGDNRIEAAAENRGGVGALSAPVTVTLDLSIPETPIGLFAESLPAGEVRLRWNAAAPGQVITYNVYRSASEQGADSGQRLNASPITSPVYVDMPVDDGLYSYRVSAVNDLGVESPLSNPAVAEADSTPPRALALIYETDGAFDSDSGRMAPGYVTVTVEVSEQLLTRPFLSIAPAQGVPIAIALDQLSQTEYRGGFEITSLTPSGTALAVFSARDRVGNRGTEIDSGASLELDTDGPSVDQLTLDVDAPIETSSDDPIEIAVQLELSEAPKSGTVPELSFTLSGPGREPAPVALAEIDPLVWEGIFELPADAGLDEAESLSFSFHALDDLDNEGTTIRAANQFQVYQGSLPPLDAPAGLQATALPAGEVELKWNAVPGAVGYQLYRQAPSDVELIPLGSIQFATDFVDTTSEDGVHLYAVASLREANGRQALSGPSNPVEVTSDSVSPNPPQNLTLELRPQGILAAWDAPVTDPSGDVDVTYSLYRADLPLGQDIDVEGHTPLESGIPRLPGIGPTGGTHLDGAPSPSEHAYAVTAVDSAGNESLPSNTVYLNFDLLPVTSVDIVRNGSEPPVVSWTHSSQAALTYRVFVGGQDEQQLVQESGATSYLDTGAGSVERSYEIVAVDAGGAESLGRTVLLPAVEATLPAGTELARGVFNRVAWQVTNRGSQPLAGVRLRVALEGKQHISDPIELAAGETRAVPVVIGGYRDLPFSASATTTLEVSATPTERVRLINQATIAVVNSALSVTVDTDAFTRGGAGRVRFRVDNTSEVETEILTAVQNGQQPSPEVRFKLLDSDDNVLTAQVYCQVLGAGVVTLPNGETVARIAAGGSFTSEWLDIPVPDSAPDRVRVVVEIDSLHYASGQPGHIDIDGLRGSSEASPSDVAYFGELLDVAPEVSFGDEPILITGRAVDSINGALVSNAELRVVLRVQGFEQVFRTFTDQNGEFSFTYTPASTDAGVFLVSIVHPDRLDRPEHGSFTIESVTITPTQFELRIPKNYRQTLALRATAGDATVANNVRVEYRAEDQVSGELPHGVMVELPAAVNLGSGQSAVLNVNVTADNSAEALGMLRLRVMSDSRSEPLALVRVSYSLSEASPALFHTPSLVEAGVTYDSSANESVAIENRGLAAVTGLHFELLDQTAQGPAPSWISLITAADLALLDVGQSFRSEIMVQPTDSIPEGYHEFVLRVTADNHPVYDIPIVVAVLADGIGHVLFHASDIYTATLDENGQPIPGLADARISIQHEDVFTLTEEGFTDETGELLINELPAGRYLFRASAPDHQDVSGRFQIRPGLTEAVEVFLMNEVISVEWSVRQISLEDRYEIVLNATFETDVPVAVLVLEPASVPLPTMRRGEVFYGELTLTNYGLIRAQDITAQFPPADEFYRYEFLREVPETLEPHERVVIPYRITALRSLDPTLDEQSTGGGVPCLVQVPVTIQSISICTAEVFIPGTTRTVFVNSWRCNNNTSEMHPVERIEEEQQGRGRPGSPAGCGSSCPGPPARNAGVNWPCGFDLPCGLGESQGGGGGFSADPLGKASSAACSAGVGGAHDFLEDWRAQGSE